MIFAPHALRGYGATFDNTSALTDLRLGNPKADRKWAIPEVGVPAGVPESFHSPISSTIVD
ncbi:hypothetical protein [Nonomuraea sp. B19D2]|uniref:hypothetical protein n=1 Tax=Nonomuraea sp. B19D2 TaxID=3159561 RepID=UPI0032D9DA35